ncbi:MAG: MipA/OmpV family protein, partial [Proteobacteria bacterium]|nr:MipA/OmpV family protein [Pseudomonadota bacterium]
EVGPRLQITLARAARDAKIDLELPLRAVFSTDLSDLHYRGVTFSPAIAYQNESFFGPTEIKLGMAAIFASDELMAYFYEVEPRFAARLTSHHGATNDDSPLFRDKTTASVGAGLVFSLFQSKRRERD